MLNICLKDCIQSYLTLFTPLTRLQWVNRGRDQRHRVEQKPVIGSFDRLDWTVFTRTLRKTSQYAFEGSREAPSSDGWSGSSRWGYNWLLYSTRGVSPVAHSQKYTELLWPKAKAFASLLRSNAPNAEQQLLLKNAVLESLAIQQLKTEETILKGSNWWNSVHNSTGWLFIAK